VDDPTAIPNSFGDPDKELKVELAEVQVQFVEASAELDKTRSLLRVQKNLNEEQKRLTETLKARMDALAAEHNAQLAEYKRLLNMRAERVQKLESQLREAAYGNVKSAKACAEDGLGAVAREASVHAAGGQALFEIHVQRLRLTTEFAQTLASAEPSLFATWSFYDHDVQYTRMLAGPEAEVDTSAYYKIRLDDSTLDFLSGQAVLLDAHMATPGGCDCKRLASAALKLSEVLAYPSNRLHGSAMLDGEQGPIGTVDYWFQLYTAGN